MDEWEDRLARLDAEESGEDSARVARLLSALLDKIRQRSRPMGQDKYTVVVECVRADALADRVPSRVFVLPTAKLSEKDKADIKDASGKGDSEVFFFVVGDTGIENLKWDLLHRR